MSIQQHPLGFEIRTEPMTIGDVECNLTTAYTPNGECIGNVDMAERLYNLGIAPETISGNNMCSIGFCQKEQKWYGWSHRAIFGFGIGDIIEEGDCAASSGWTDEYLQQRPGADKSLPVGFKAETLDDCKRMAIAFADSVA